MSPITLFCVPHRTFSNLDFPPTYPLDLDGPYTLLTEPSFAAASSTTPGHPLGLSASEASMIHRNWRPCSWDITGYCLSGVTVEGAANAPGPVTGGTTFTGPVELSYFAEFQGLPSNPVRPQPDFSDPVNQRTMISWGGLGAGPYPDIQTVYGDGAYPVLIDPEGGNATGCYLGLTFSINGTIEPYFWQRGGSHYLEHDFDVIITSAYYFFPGDKVPDSWFLDEGQNVGIIPAGWESLNTAFDRVASGTFGFQDTTGDDPTNSWGSLTMYTIGGTQTFSCDLTARVRSNFLSPTFG